MFQRSKRLLDNCTAQFTIIFFTVNLLICLFLTGNVYFNTDFLMKRYIADYHVDEALHISNEELYLATDTTIDMIKGKSTDYEFKVVVKGIEDSFLNSKEIRHVKELADAYKSFKTRFFRIIIFDILILGSVLVMRKRCDLVKDMAKGFLLAQALFAAILGALGIWFASDPLHAINKTHKLFFEGDNWILNPATDRLIYLCPEQLIIYCVKNLCTVMAIYILVGCALAIVTLVIKAKKKFLTGFMGPQVI